MARRPPKRRPRVDPDEAHREMLEHLERNPPPRPEADGSAPPRPSPRKSKSAPSPAPPPERPRLMLRHLRRELALSRLESFLGLHRHQGRDEVVVVVGKGRGSGPEGPVLGDAVREFCARRPDLVATVREAPAREGGAGALVLVLAAKG